jgi:hypothetical protein
MYWTVPGFRHATERIAENIDIFDFALASEDWYDSEVRFDSGPAIDQQTLVRLFEPLTRGRGQEKKNDTGERGGPDPEQVSPQTFSITNRD